MDKAILVSITRNQDPKARAVLPKKGSTREGGGCSERSNWTPGHCAVPQAGPAHLVSENSRLVTLRTLFLFVL